ncbi:2-phospho-L-lactate transferase [Candidatus Bathyarchaeota archaeon]|nr:2-phospho-L-lactate transferase [Candidatus Bathyarchaeota archaeon]
MNRVTCLAGGVGAARFLQGLVRVLPEENVTVIVNTGDDIELHGLRISPDIDIVTYTLADIVDEEKGWGIKGDTFHCLEFLKRYGYEAWFNLGDMDLATHISRTRLLREGLRLSEVTDRHRRALGVKARILPMTDDRFETYVKTNAGKMHFQEYLVKRGSTDQVLGVCFEGAEEAKPSQGVLESIESSDGIIVCPSNPIVSIGTILSVGGIREALQEASARIVGISPIVGGRPVKGPADKLMEGLGLEVSAHAVADLYKDFLDAFIIDNADSGECGRIEGLGIDVIATNTVMRSMLDKISLAEAALKALRMRG